MAAFQYTALNQAGQQQKGILEADTAKQVRQLLRDKNLLPLTVELILKPAIKNYMAFNKQKLSAKELTLMTRQIASLLASSLPIEEILSIVAEQNEQQKIQSILFAVRAKILEGYTFSASLSEFPHAFSSAYCATVAAGERSGHLDTVLLQLADYTEQQLRTRHKIQHALIYPSIMIFISIAIVSFLLAFVVPKMIAVFSTMHQTLPWLTQILLFISNGLKNFGIYILLGLMGGGFLFYQAIKNKLNFRYKFHTWLLKLPLLGHSAKTINTTRFARTFAILSQAGVPALEAMQIATSLITFLPMQKAITIASQRVREGASIHWSLQQTGFFTPMSIHLIANGEASGQLEQMLERIAKYQEEEVNRLIETSLTLLEPAIILFMGAIVLFIVLAVLLPIFSLDQFTG